MTQVHASMTQCANLSPMRTNEFQARGPVFRSPSSRERFLAQKTQGDSAKPPKRVTKPHAPASSTPARKAMASGSFSPSKLYKLGPGDVVDNKYTIIRLLGAGGMGRVYEAEHMVTNKRVALKVMQPELVRSPRAKTEFMREVKVDNKVDTAMPPVSTGPGTVPIYDSGVDKNLGPYAVMEKLDGRTLERLAVDYAKEKKMISPVGVAQALDEVLQTLEAAHEQGIIHRDIKPENLFVNKQLDVKVLDWGLAQKKGDKPTLGHFVGTPGYAPPEQTLGLPSDESSDTWSVGATGYALLTNRIPVRPETAVAAGVEYANRSRHARCFTDYPTCPIPPTRSVAPHVPEHIAAVVDKALACDPKERYATARAMREDLERAMQAELSKG